MGQKPRSKWLPRDPENLLESAYAHFLACKVLGIIPFSQVKTSSGIEYRLSHKGTIYAATVLVLYVTFFQLAVDEMSQLKPRSFNEMSNITAWGQVYAIIISMLVGIFTCWFNQTKIMFIMHRLVEVDETLDKLNAKPSYEEQYKVIAVHLSALLSLVLTSVMSNCAILNPNGVSIQLDTLCFWFICFFPIAVNLLTIVVFIYLLRFSRVRIEIINRLITQATPLSGLKRTENGQITLTIIDNVTTIPVKDRVKFVRQLAAMHGLLCALAGRINSIFGFHLLVNVAITFAIITVQLYYVFAMTIGNLEMDAAMFSCIIISIGVQSCEMVFIVTIASNIETQAKRTGILLHTWNTSTCERALHDAIEMFSMQIIHSDMRITACGFFRLHFGLLTSMVGAVTTYLVIIIQFHLASESSSTKVTNTTTTLK